MSFLDKWLDNRIQKAEKQDQLQLITLNSQEAASTSQQYVSGIQKEIHMQALEIRAAAEALRLRVENGQLDIKERREQIAKGQEDRKRTKTLFKLQCREQQQELGLKKRLFYYEQNRINKTLEFDHTISMGELQLRKFDMEQHYVLEHKKLDIQDKQLQYQRESLEAGRTEQLSINREAAQSREQEYRHKEKMQELELTAKKFERELHMIRLMDVEVQQQAYADLRKRMQERIDSFNNSGNGSLHDAY